MGLFWLQEWTDNLSDFGNDSHKSTSVERDQRGPLTVAFAVESRLFRAVICENCCLSGRGSYYVAGLRYFFVADYEASFPGVVDYFLLTASYASL